MSNNAVIRYGGFKFRGNWSSVTAYNPNDAVMRNSSLWISLTANTNVDPYTDNGTNWQEGAAGLFYRGAWSSGTTYSANDVVTYLSQTYLSLQGSNLNNTPSSSPTFWSLIAAQGNVAPRQTTTFTLPSSSITQVAVTSNVATITSANSFAIGNTVYISGLSGASFLNGQVLTITTQSPTQFTANFTHANYGPTADTGTATFSIPNGGQYFTTITLGKTFALSFVQCNQATRIELYSTNAARTADSSRPATTQPTVGTQHGVITDLNLDGVVASFSSWVMSPLAYGANLQDDTVNVPATITNISGAPSTNTFQIIFTFTFEEE